MSPDTRTTVILWGAVGIVWLAVIAQAWWTGKGRKG
jgi:hypothetical protein